ncbi:MAPEG family protein [Gammaproteobacteria bacterium]|nr:hypothetical protein [Flavobacteriaceae bacterium]MDC0392296.1 MAPEG family protein [Gammaproteobacteria bacterium]
MSNLIICVGIFYLVHLFLTMTLSLHKVPFIEWTYTKGDTSKLTELSSRMTLASNNLRQSLSVFFIFAILSIVLEVDNLMLAQSWFGFRVAYLLGAILNLYRFKMIRPVIWLPSIIVLVCMGCNLYI